jgi:ribosomal protein S18 acetylase RimI-like enzyme
MAALAEPHLAVPLLVDLRQIRAEELDPLLGDAIEEWERRLDWDFRPSADLVRRFIRMQALTGYALVVAREVVGYCYYVCEDRKGLMGDIFVRPDHASPENEATLVTAVVRALWATPHVQRIESQLIMLSQAARSNLPFAAHVRRFPRDFMMADMSMAPSLVPAANPRLQFEGWQERDQEQAARLIAHAYVGHVDAEINDQYRSVAGGRRFLYNIVQYPGCGSFFKAGSFIAQDAVTGRLAGLSLASLVAFDVGHITQVCVDPEWKGRRVGYELMRRSLDAFLHNGCRRVSLTVTSSNEEAIRLYERLGFRKVDAFEAFVWEGLR